jgi:hypothetical protein
VKKLEAGFFNSLLLQFRQPVDDPQSDFITDLHLDHFGRETCAHALGILEFELHMAPTSLDKVKQQHRRQSLKLIVGGVLTHIEDLGHERMPFFKRWPSTLMSEEPVRPQCLKRRGWSALGEA